MASKLKSTLLSAFFRLLFNKYVKFSVCSAFSTLTHCLISKITLKMTTTVVRASRQSMQMTRAMSSCNDPQSQLITIKNCKPSFAAIPSPFFFSPRFL